MSRKDIIGKRIRVQIGGEPPKEDDAIVGDDVSVYVPAEDVGKYDSITGEKVEVRIGEDIDQIVQEILSTVETSQIYRRDEIVATCREILQEKDQKSKLARIPKLISIASDIAQIAAFIVLLEQLLL